MAWIRGDGNYQEIDRRTHGEIRKKILTCKKLNLKSASFEYVQERVAEAISGYAKNVLHIDLRDKVLYRARKCEDNKSWNKKSELWYNPKIEAIQFGRTNLQQQQVLYLASDIFVAGMEVRVKPKDRINVLECKYIGDRRKIYFLDFLLFEKEIFPRLKLNVLGKKIDLEKELGRNNYLKYQAIHGFISNEFRKVIELKEEYKITAAIANLLWYSEDNDDAILYPSIASNYDGFNMAFKPELADKIFKVSRVLEIEVGDITPDGSSEWAIRRIGTCDEGSDNIIWQ